MSSVQISVRPRVRAIARQITLMSDARSLGLRNLGRTLSCRIWRAAPNGAQKRIEEST